MRGKGFKPYSAVKFLVYECNSRQYREFYLSLPKNLTRTRYIVLAIFCEAESNEKLKSAIKFETQLDYVIVFSNFMHNFFIKSI